MSKQSLYIGKQGEARAAALLKEKGYKILATNYKNKLGEIDIIALDKDTLCFVEVKTRNSLRFGLPQEAVSKSKQRRICRVALYFLKEKGLLDKKARFDVVSAAYSGLHPELELIQDAFELDEDLCYPT